MLLTVDDARLMDKYLEEIGEDVYRLKNIMSISHKDKEKLLELDNLQYLCYGKHIIEDYQQLEEKQKKRHIDAMNKKK